MPIFRDDVNEVYDENGLVSSTPRQVDITAEVVYADVIAKARLALEVNRTYLALGTPSNAQNLAQIRALTRQHQGIFRALGKVLPELADLLLDETADT